MATATKNSKKDIINDLELKNQELQKENDELKAQMEEKEEQIKALKEELKKEPKKKEKKEPEYFNGDLKDYTELDKDLITKKELLEWIKNPEEVKNIRMTKQKNKSTTEKGKRTQKDGNICFARVWNEGKGGRCNNTAKDNKWCYCSQHDKQYTERKLKHGDIRITGEGSIPLFKKFEKILGYTGEMLCEEVDGDIWKDGF